MSEPKLIIGTRVRVWMNLHLAKQGKPHWSVGDPKTNKVLCNVASICLEQAKPIVSEATFQRIQRIGRRKVYARVEGIISALAPDPVFFLSQRIDVREIHCNPHRTKDFTEPSGESWTGSPAVYFPDAGFFYAGGIPR